LRAGYILAGIIFFVFGAIIWSYGHSLELTAYYTRNPRTGISEWQPGLSHYGMILELFGFAALVFGGAFGIGGLLAKPVLHVSTKKDVSSSLKDISVPVIMLGGTMVGIVLLALLIRDRPIILGLSFLLFVGYFLLQGVLLPILGIIYKFLGFFYEEAKPKGTFSKVATAIFSVAFGIVWLNILASVTGGFIGLFTPFFFNLIGFLLGVIVSFIFMVIAIVIIGIARALLRRSS